MKKIICFLVTGFVLTSFCFAQNSSDVTVTVEITNVAVNNGKVLLAIFATADSFKKEEPEFAFELESDKTAVSTEVTLPAGEYLISALQDSNNNQKPDYNLIGIPKDMVAISNYSGKGFPSRNFDKQKIKIDSTTEKVTVGLYKF